MYNDIALVKSVKEDNLFDVMVNIQKIIDLLDDYWYKFSTGSNEVNRDTFENTFKICLQEFERALNENSKNKAINNQLAYLDGYLMAYDHIYRTKLNLTDNVKKYLKIMHRYYSGEFGDENLSIANILVKAGEPNLLETMDFYELKYLQQKSTSIQIKSLFGKYMAELSKN